MGPRQRHSHVLTTHASCAATRMALARRLSTATSCSSSVAPHFVISEEARIRDRLLGGRSPSERRLSAARLITSALPNALAAGCLRSVATATLRPRPRRTNSASSSASLGAASRSSSRSSGRRTRSSAGKPNCNAPSSPAHESSTRSGATFSSGLRRTPACGGTQGPHEARGVLPHRAMTRGRRVKGAPGDGVGAEALETPAPWGVSRQLVPRRRRTRLLDRGVSGGLGSNVFRVILLGRDRRRHGPQHGKQPARARRSPRTHAGYARPASRPRIPCSSSPPSHEAVRTVATQA
jgi:hypothetical protein